jgi:hypothetical protein
MRNLNLVEAFARGKAISHDAFGEVGQRNAEGIWACVEKLSEDELRSVVFWHEVDLEMNEAVSPSVGADEWLAA